MRLETDVLRMRVDGLRRFSPQILSPDLKQSLLEDDHDSRLIPTLTRTIDTALKCVTRPLVGPHGPGSSRSFL